MMEVRWSTRIAVNIYSLSHPEDELLNVEIEERTKDKKRNELKTKRRDYTGYDDDEFAEGNAGSKRAVLAKYDEDINGAPQTVSLHITYCHIYSL